MSVSASRSREVSSRSAGASWLVKWLVESEFNVDDPVDKPPETDSFLDPPCVRGDGGVRLEDEASLVLVGFAGVLTVLWRSSTCLRISA